MKTEGLAIDITNPNKPIVTNGGQNYNLDDVIKVKAKALLKIGFPYHIYL